MKVLTRSCSSAPASPPPRSDSRAAGGLDRLHPGDRVGSARVAGLIALLRGLGEGRVDPGPDRSLASLPLAVHPGPTGHADQRGGEHRRGQGQREQATPALAGGPGLGPGLGQLGLPQPPLDAAEIRRQPGDHRARVPRPVLRRGGEARPRQPHQLRVGVARVEACPRVRQVGPLRLAVDLGRGPSRERGLAGEDLAEDRAQREDVRPLVQRVQLAPGLLGRHVRRRAEHRADPRIQPLRFAAQRPDGGGAVAGAEHPLLVGHAPLVEHLGQAPIHDLHLAERPDHDVRRLQVPVDDPSAVGVGHRLADLLEDREELHPILIRAPARLQQRRQGAAPDELHRDEQPAVGEASQVVDRRDPGVLELAADLGLLDEPADHLGVVAVLLPDHLDGEVPAEVEVAPLEDRPHPAPGQLADELVARRLSREVGHLRRTGPDQPRGVRRIPEMDASDRPDRTVPGRRGGLRREGPVLPAHGFGDVGRRSRAEFSRQIGR